MFTAYVIASVFREAIPRYNKYTAYWKIAHPHLRAGASVVATNAPRNDITTI